MIKAFFVLFFSCMLVSFTGFTQAQLPPVYEIKTDTVQEQIIDSVYWQKLEDKEGKWTFSDVSKEPLSGRFHIQVESPPIAHTSWQRYRLKNTLQKAIKIAFTSSADFYDLYVKRDTGTVTHLRSGVLRKWAEKDSYKSAEYLRGALLLEFAAGEEVLIYDRRNLLKQDITKITVRYISTEKIINEYVDYTDSRQYIFQENNIYEMFTAGLMFLAFLISLFFYRVIKEQVYLLFALFSLSICIINLHNTAANFTSWFQPALSWLVPFLFSLIPWIFIYYFLIQFIRKFFEVKNKYPKWDKLLFWTGIRTRRDGIVRLLIVLSAVEGGAFDRLLNVFTPVMFFGFCPFVIIITILLYIRKRQVSFRYVSIGVLPLMLTFIFTLPAIFYSNSSANPIAIFRWIGENSWLLMLICMAWLALWFVRVLMMRYVQLQQENIQQAIEKEKERNELVAAQKIQLEKEVTARTAELASSLQELKSTQSQLIQSEKMASLGELTAGIAHEIQNPLNFVNNFSEVNKELIEELNAERKKPNAERNEQLENELLNDIKENEEKINHHGKRAGDIVKGMLQHSRQSSGKKEPSDINALADEYLRLAYHGLRAKDKSFNAAFETNFDSTLPKLNVIPQDIGRVILNLINNAFYAVNEKKKSAGLSATSYEPLITIQTKKANDKIEVIVTDNGNGIPQNIIDKIFQPFFTTKPTGQGTGLGLSLSYDIIRAHGGEIKVETKEEEGTTFIIQLPVV